jgi:2-oxo-4-hydroxy-4-carboxy-5-ureidoimidazoline decarboxylase
MLNLDRINAWSDTEAHAAFLHCCGSTSWAGQLTVRRPFAEEADLLAAAEQAWQGLSRQDWLEVFAAHPKIGAVKSLRKKFADIASWPAGEQAGVAGASDAVLRELAEANRQYEAKFGYIFIVSATGKSAAEMLALLRRRLDNDPEEEFEIAVLEQKKITSLRLQKL